MNRSQIVNLIRLFNPQFEEKSGKRVKTINDLKPILFKFLEEI